MAEYERRVSRGRFDEFACGKRRCDVLPSAVGVQVEDVIWYREFNYLDAEYTGRSLRYVVRLVQRGQGLPEDSVLLSLDPAIDNISLQELADAYLAIRAYRMEPNPCRLVERFLQFPGGVELVGQLVGIADAVFGRLFPNGKLSRYYTLVEGPLTGVRVAERELAALNGLVVMTGQYVLQSGDVAVWQSRKIGTT